VVEWVRYNARSNVFAKALPLLYVKTVEAALTIVENTPRLRQRMWQIARLLQSGLTELGFDIGAPSLPSRRST